MAPSINKDGYNESKITFKRLLSIFVSKEKIKRDKPEDDLVCDALPDQAFEKKSGGGISQHPDQSRKAENEDTSRKSDQWFSQNEDDLLNDKDEKENKEEGDSKQKKDENRGIGNVYASCVDSIHIGNTYSQTWNIKQTHNEGVPKKGKKNVKLTPQIKALLDADVSLGEDYIQYLSRHFGKSYRNIGLKLNFSNGEIDDFENSSGNDLRQVAFEILLSWKRNEGDNATVGKLCTKLWLSGVSNAQEAVQKLSKDFSKFNE